MNIRPAITAAFAGLTFLAVSVSTAAADIWWETEEGTLSWDDVVGDYAVFRFLDDNNQPDHRLTIFIDDLGKQFSSVGVQPGRYSGAWFQYEDADEACPLPHSGPDGKQAAFWGAFWITFHEDYNYFTADVSKCDSQEFELILNGTPGQ